MSRAKKQMFFKVFLLEHSARRMVTEILPLFLQNAFFLYATLPAIMIYVSFVFLSAPWSYVLLLDFGNLLFLIKKIYLFINQFGLRLLALGVSPSLKRPAQGEKKNICLSKGEDKHGHVAFWVFLLYDTKSHELRVQGFFFKNFDQL